MVHSSHLNLGSSPSRQSYDLHSNSRALLCRRLCTGSPTSVPSVSPRSQPAPTVTRIRARRAAASLPGRRSSCPAHMCSTTRVSLLWRSSPWGTVLLSTCVPSAALAIRRKFLNTEFTGRIILLLGSAGGEGFTSIL